MRRRLPICSSLLIALLLSVPGAADAAKSKKPQHAAQAPDAPPSERLGTARYWTAYTYDEKSGKVCYIASEARKRDPSAGKNRHPVAMVTHRPGEKAANVVSFAQGYQLKDGSDLSLDIDGEKFDLFTKGDGAWARTSDLDRTIVEAMVKGKEAAVKGTSEKGTVTTDTYSLAGFTRALALIDKACDVKR